MANGTVVLAAADAPTCIFLSSTSRDLAEHRRAVVRECADSGYALTVMEELARRTTTLEA